MDKDLTILVISCDEYSDLWNDFFKLKEINWPDCPYDVYLVNNEMTFCWPGVRVINCGYDAKWSSRVRKALSQVNTKYVCPILEDHFISGKVDTDSIRDLMQYVATERVMHLTFGKVIYVDKKNIKYTKNGLAIIPSHTRYGIDAAAAIWNKDFYLEMLGEGDYTAWEFEHRMCERALSAEGLPGLILWDTQNLLKVNPIEVVRRGKFRPDAIRYYKEKLGYDLDTSKRPVMSFWEDLNDTLKSKLAGMHSIRPVIKKFARLFGYKFLTTD